MKKLSRSNLTKEDLIQLLINKINKLDPTANLVRASDLINYLNDNFISKDEPPLNKAKLSNFKLSGNDISTVTQLFLFVLAELMVIED